MEVTQGDNLDKYRSYIQRRRVVDIPVGNPSVTGALAEKQEIIEKSERSFLRDSDQIPSGNAQHEESETQANYSEEPTDSYGGFSSFDQNYGKPWIQRNTYEAARATRAIKRPEKSPYRRLYGNDQKNSHLRSFGSYRSNSSSGHTTEIEDNRTTVLAIKIIKQALACFVVLGIVVLMQQRSDTSEALTFVKKHVVDTHIDFQNLLTGVETLFKECSRFLGGSP